MQVLEQYFDNLHRLHVRLHKLTSLEPGANQSTSGFFSEFLRLANEADSSKIMQKRLLLAIMTTKCPNKKLRTELLCNPTSVEETVTKAQQYDAAQKMQGRNETAAALQKCFRCNKTNHRQDNCWTYHSPCPTCGKSSHTKNKCRVRPQNYGSPKLDQQNKPKGQNQQQKNTTNTANKYGCGLPPKVNL